MIRAVEISKWFGLNQVLKSVDLSVGSGEVVGVIGPSGSGKSTLLRCIAGLESFESGEVYFGGRKVYTDPRGRRLSERKISETRRHVGMVFQSFNLFPHMSVMENVCSGQRYALGRNRVDSEERARRLLHTVGLGDKLDSYPEELSGGQQQRVAIARALAMEPQVMLFDEPTSALDAELVGEVLTVMRNLASTGMTMVVVTHELAFVRRVSSRIVFMADGQIVEEGRPEAVLSRPKHSRVQDFIRAVISHDEKDGDTVSPSVY